MEMDITAEKINDQAMSTRRRSSILKVPKNKTDAVEAFEDITVSKSIRRVSFASSNFVKPFVADPDKNTIWDTTYEEEINHTDSTQSSQEHPLTICSKLESTLFNSMKNVSTSSVDITKGAIFEDKENVPVAPHKISIIDYAKRGMKNSVVPLYQLPLQKVQKDMLESFANDVTQLHPQTMEFTYISADTKKIQEVQVGSYHDISEATLVDMELTCNQPTVKFGKSSYQTGDTTEGDLSHNNMEITCQVPTSTVDVANEEQSVSSNLELTCQMSDNDELFETDTMEFTCQIPQNKTIFIKEKIAKSEGDFGSHMLTTIENSVKTSRVLTENKLSQLRKEDMSRIGQSSVMVETCMYSKTLEDMDFTCQITKNALFTETLKNVPNVINSTNKCNEKETFLKLPQNNSDINPLSSMLLETEKTVKDESQKDEPLSREFFLPPTGSANSIQSTTEVCPMEVTYCDHPLTLDESTKNLRMDSKIPMSRLSTINRDIETPQSPCRMSFIQNESTLVTKSNIAPTNSNIKRTDMTDICNNNEIEESMVKMQGSYLNLTCTSSVTNDENIPPLINNNSNELKTPESSFHINVTNINTLLDDTQHLVHCTFTKPALDSFKMMQFDFKNNEEKTVSHISVPNITNQCEVNDTYVDDVRSNSQTLSDDSLNCFRKTKLADINDTYVLKGKVESLKTEQKNPFEETNKNEDTLLERDSELDDSSLGYINVDECVNLDKLTIEAKISSDIEKTSFQKWLDNFEFTEYNIEFKKDINIPEKIERINKQRAQIREILETFKFKPIPIPDTLSFTDKFLNNDTESPQPNLVNQCVQLTLEDKIRKHEESSQNSWKLKKIDGHFYTFSTLFGTLLLTVEIHPEGRVVDIRTSKNLADGAEPIALYLVKVFSDRLDNIHVKSAIGENYDIFSLLDYVQMTMVKLLELQEDLVKCHMLTLDENFMAKFKMLSTVAGISCELKIDVSNLENIDYEAIEISTRIGRVDENEIKKIIKLKNPKGFSFFNSFAECSKEYITVKEKRSRSMKRKVY